MIYTFTDADITALGVTDNVVKSLLRNTSIVDSDYDDGLPMYVAYMKPNFHFLGGVDVRRTSNGSKIISLMTENERTKITVYDGTKVRIGSETLNGSETYDIHYTIGTIGSGGGSSNKAGNDTTNISEVTHLYVKGKSNIFGIVYDGDKTLTYGNNSININVYADNALTIRGQKGVKGIIFNGKRVKSVILNGATHILTDKIICTNGIALPKPPNQKALYGDNKNHWLIRDNGTTGYYDLIYSSRGFGFYNDVVYPKNDNDVLQTGYSTAWYRISKANPTDYWVYNNTTSNGFSIDADRPIIASSDDIMTYSAMSTVTSTVNFAKTHEG